MSAKDPDANSGPLRGGLLERFLILGKLGSGATANVYRARQLSLDREVVLKVLDLPPSAMKEQRPRFEQECAILAGLRHTNIVQILEHGVEENQFYLAYPATEGKSLDLWIRQNPSPTPLEVACWARDILRGLEAAHAAGVIHRDIKPGNLLLLPDGTAQLLDFGLARQLDEARLTKTGVWVGTPAYASPEQIQSPDIDGRTDLYSLGIVLYLLLTGEQPFLGSFSEVLRLQLEHRPPPVSQVNDTIPPELSDLVMQMLEKDPEDRPDSARVAREWIERVLTELRSGALPRPPESSPQGTLALEAPGTATEGRPQGDGSLEATQPVVRGSWRSLLARLGLTLGLAAMIGALVVRPSGEATSDPGAARWEELLGLLSAEAEATADYSREQRDPLRWEAILAGLPGAAEVRRRGEAPGGFTGAPPSVRRQLAELGRSFARGGLPDPVAPYLPTPDLPAACPLLPEEVAVLEAFGVDPLSYRPTGPAREVVFASRRVRQDLDRLRAQLWSDQPVSDPAVLDFRDNEMVVASHLIGEPDLDRLDFALEFRTGRLRMVKLMAGAVTPRVWRSLVRTRELLAQGAPGAPTAWALTTHTVAEYHPAFFGGAGYLSMERLLGGEASSPELRFLWAVLRRNLRHAYRGAGGDWMDFVTESNAAVKTIAPWVSRRPKAMLRYVGGSLSE